MTTVVNSKADVMKASQALQCNVIAAEGLGAVMKACLGPRGTLQMLVGGAGQVKITKDGNVLLQEMAIQYPTATMIARTATAQDDIVGDGTTSSVLLIAELMKLSARYITSGVHSRFIADGLEIARIELDNLLDEMKIPVNTNDTEILSSVARTALRTKLDGHLADTTADAVVGAISAIRADTISACDPDSSEFSKENPPDLHLIEVLPMKQRLGSECRLVKGIVMDHGCRHVDMPHKLSNCYILTISVSLEFDNAEVNAGFFYSSPDQREKLAISERRLVNEKVWRIIELKRSLCDATCDETKNRKSFVVINQKGIDGPSLDMLAKEGIMALRRAKRRNMERITLACGGSALNSVDDLTIDDLGYADTVYEVEVEDDKYTFVEGTRNPKSVTILIKGGSDHVIKQLTDAVRDGLRAVINTIVDGCVLPGAGAFELLGHQRLRSILSRISGKKSLGLIAFADALLVIPSTLAENSGFDKQEVILQLISEVEKKGVGSPVGIDIHGSGLALEGDDEIRYSISPVAEGIFDNYIVKKQQIGLITVLTQQLILVDEVIRAGKKMG